MKLYNSLLENLKKSEAYWISPKGKILPMGNSNHITEVINNPEAFDLTLDKIKAIYNKHNEKLGIEGKAREEIIKSLITKNWIRIRKYIRPDYWSVNINKLDNRTKNYLQYWASEMIKISYGLYSDVYIDSPIFKKKYILNDLRTDILYNESKRSKKYKCEFVGGL